MMKSNLFRELTDDELKTVVRELLHTTPTSARLLSGGLFNTTYLVDTADCGKTVLRVGPVNRHLLLPYEHFLMEAETEVYSLCRKAGVPSSEVLAADWSKTVLDRDFMFVKYIPSTAMHETPLTDTERERIRGDAWRAMRLYNGITGEKFGRPHDILHGGGFARWSDALMKEIDEFEAVCVPTGLFSADEHKRIRGLYDTARPILDEIAVPHLLHADLWEGNILVKEDADGNHSFAALIDADRALWGDPDFELPCMDYWTKDSPAFREAYGVVPDETAHTRIRRLLYDLLMKIWAVYIYEIEYNDPHQHRREYLGSLRVTEELSGLTGRSS